MMTKSIISTLFGSSLIVLLSCSSLIAMADGEDFSDDDARGQKYATSAASACAPTPFKRVSAHVSSKPSLTYESYYPREFEDTRTKTMIEQLKTDGRLCLESPSPLTFEHAQEDATRLGKAISESGVKKVSLNSAYWNALRFDATRSMAKAIAGAQGLETIGFYDVRWWVIPPCWEQRDDRRSYLALGNFIKTLSANRTLQKVSFLCFPSMEQARNLCESFPNPKRGLPFEVVFATGANHVYRKGGIEEITDIAIYLRGHFGEKVKFDVPLSYDYSYDYKTRIETIKRIHWQLSPKLGNINAYVVPEWNELGYLPVPVQFLLSKDVRRITPPYKKPSVTILSAPAPAPAAAASPPAAAVLSQSQSQLARGTGGKSGSASLGASNAPPLPTPTMALAVSGNGPHPQPPAIKPSPQPCTPIVKVVHQNASALSGAGAGAGAAPASAPLPAPVPAPLPVPVRTSSASALSASPTTSVLSVSPAPKKSVTFGGFTTFNFSAEVDAMYDMGDTPPATPIGPSPLTVPVSVHGTFVPAAAASASVGSSDTQPKKAHAVKSGFSKSVIRKGSRKKPTAYKFKLPKLDKPASEDASQAAALSASTIVLSPPTMALPASAIVPRTSIEAPPAQRATEPSATMAIPASATSTSPAPASGNASHAAALPTPTMALPTPAIVLRAPIEAQPPAQRAIQPSATMAIPASATSTSPAPASHPTSRRVSETTEPTSEETSHAAAVSATTTALRALIAAPSTQPSQSGDTRTSLLLPTSAHQAATWSGLTGSSQTGGPVVVTFPLGGLSATEDIERLGSASTSGAGTGSVRPTIRLQDSRKKPEISNCNLG